MPMSVPMKEAYAAAERYDGLLTANSFSPQQFVTVELDDGSRLTWESALLRRWRNWAVVFTEHYGFHVFSNDDVDNAFEWKITGRLDDIDYLVD